MSNTRITPEERKQRTAELRSQHQVIFDKLNISDAVYVPKMAYNEPTLNRELVMGFFESELDACTDIYTEMVSNTLNPEDRDRTLYKYRANPHYKTEYHNKPTPSGNDRWLVPVTELVVVDDKEVASVFSTMKSKKGPATVLKNLKTSSSGKEDMLVKDMTVRDLYTLLTGNPVSSHEWINNLVK